MQGVLPRVAVLLVAILLFSAIKTEDSPDNVQGDGGIGDGGIGDGGIGDGGIGDGRIGLISAAALKGDRAKEDEGNGKAIPGSCPACDERTCYTDLTCQDGQTLVEKTSACDCCPSCKVYLDLGQPCSPTHGPSCAAGLECAAGLVCAVKKERSCDSFKYIKDVMWIPECLEDGSYAPKQCKGEELTGRCFCTSSDGNRLFGQEWWSQAENMTCACSRRISDLQKQGRTDVTLHCTENGNYEPLQCDDGLCWCAEELTGQPITPVLPEDNAYVLPCYNETTRGIQYLRQCESLLIAQARIGLAMNSHGSIYAITTKTTCDPDGSYGYGQINEYGSLVCTWKDSSSIGSWQTPVASSQGVNCNCARDTKYYSLSGLELALACAGNGNYEPVQTFGTSAFCVDSDGYATSPIIPYREDIDCSIYPSAP